MEQGNLYQKGASTMREYEFVCVQESHTFPGRSCTKLPSDRMCVRKTVGSIQYRKLAN